MNQIVNVNGKIQHYISIPLTDLKQKHDTQTTQQEQREFSFKHLDAFFLQNNKSIYKHRKPTGSSLSICISTKKIDWGKEEGEIVKLEFTLVFLLVLKSKEAEQTIAIHSFKLSNRKNWVSFALLRIHCFCSENVYWSCGSCMNHVISFGKKMTVPFQYQLGNTGNLGLLGPRRFCQLYRLLC